MKAIRNVRPNVFPRYWFVDYLYEKESMLPIALVVFLKQRDCRYWMVTNLGHSVSNPLLLVSLYLGENATCTCTDRLKFEIWIIKC